jgi:hypothetical protein
MKILLLYAWRPVQANARRRFKQQKQILCEHA